jgi:hypothetical protein
MQGTADRMYSIDDGWQHYYRFPTALEAFEAVIDERTDRAHCGGVLVTRPIRGPWMRIEPDKDGRTAIPGLWFAAARKGMQFRCVVRWDYRHAHNPVRQAVLESLDDYEGWLRSVDGRAAQSQPSAMWSFWARL